MHCPKCEDTELTAVHVHEVEIDECASCRGIWFDENELRKVKDRTDEDLNWLDFDLWKHEDRFRATWQDTPCPRCDEQLVAVDYDSSLALVGTVREGERDVIIAVGRYSRDPATNYADCAFIVRDDWQDKGVGRHLIERLMEVARGRGIAGFTADVLVENTRMMHVFHLCAPGPVQSRIEEGSYHITFPLNPPEDETGSPVSG